MGPGSAATGTEPVRYFYDCSGPTATETWAKTVLVELQVADSRLIRWKTAALGVVLRLSRCCPGPAAG